MNQPPEVLCAGIVVADHVSTPIDHLPHAGELVTADHLLLTIGGCAANAAVDLAKMEVRAAVVGRVGRDVFGKVVADMLRDRGVDVSLLQTSDQSDTSQTLIINVKGEDRRFVHAFGANAEFSASDIPTDQARQCKVLYVGGYLIMDNVKQDELAEVFADVRRHGVKTVLDVATPGPGDYRSRLDQLLPHVDVFLPNNHEAELITGEKEPVKQAELFHRMGAGTAVITMGGDGSVLVSEKTRLRAGVFSVPFLDGSGGGDAFDAGYICGLLRGLPTEDCLRYASALGASCVRAIGTTPGVFTRGECEEFLGQQTLKIERM